MYYCDGKNVYKIEDIDKFKNMLDDKDLKDVKVIFKPVYQEELMNDSMDLLVKWNVIKSISERPYSYFDTCEWFKNYIIDRFGEDIYFKMIDGFLIDLEYQLAQISYNKAILN